MFKLIGKDTNCLYSPLSSYGVLAMCVPIFVGEMRDVLLRVLHLPGSLDDRECLAALSTMIGYDHQCESYYCV